MKKLLFLLLIITSLTSCMPAVMVTYPQYRRPVQRYYYRPMPMYRPYVYRPYYGPHTYYHNGPMHHHR